VKTLAYILGLIGVGIAGYAICKYGKGTVAGSPQATGMGATGVPRAGKPKTEAERLATHEAKYGSGELPAKGTGLSRF